MISKAHIRAALAISVVVAMLACAGIANAQGGGVDSGGGTPPPDTSGYQDAGFGSRDLSLGMSGDDVKTLNWLMTAFNGNGPSDGFFEQPTDARVRSFQAATGLGVDGIVRRDTRKQIASQMHSQNATWYGPGFWDHQTACGTTLEPTTIGVANKKLPCGTRVTFAYMGHWVRARVIDRGPYNKGYSWDLTKKLAKRLGFLTTGSGPVKFAVVR